MRSARKTLPIWSVSSIQWWLQAAQCKEYYDVSAPARAELNMINANKITLILLAPPACEALQLYVPFLLKQMRRRWVPVQWLWNVQELWPPDDLFFPSRKSRTVGCICILPGFWRKYHAKICAHTVQSSKVFTWNLAANRVMNFNINMRDEPTILPVPGPCRGGSF